MSESKPDALVPTPATAPTTGFDAPEAVFTRAKALKRTIDTAYIGLGRELYQIFHRRLFIGEGFDTFDDWVERGLGISRSRADRVRRIWTKFVKELNLHADQLQGIGYSNALTLLGIINNENAQDWLAKAKTMSWRDLALAVAAARGPTPEAIEALQNAGVEVTRKVEEDNDDLSREGGFDDIPSGGGGGALPSERSGLTSSGPSPDRRRPPTDDEEVGRVEVLNARRTTVTLQLKDDQLRVWNAALDVVKRAKKTEASLGECVAHVATEFLANRLTKEGKPEARVAFYLANFEHVFGGKFIHITSKEAADVLSKAIDEHRELFEGAAVPVTTIEEERTNYDHPDDAHDHDDADAVLDPDGGSARGG